MRELQEKANTSSRPAWNRALSPPPRPLPSASGRARIPGCSRRPPGYATAPASIRREARPAAYRLPYSDPQRPQAHHDPSRADARDARTKRHADPASETASRPNTSTERSLFKTTPPPYPFHTRSRGLSASGCEGTDEDGNEAAAVLEACSVVRPRARPLLVHRPPLTEIKRTNSPRAWSSCSRSTAGSGLPRSPRR